MNKIRARLSGALVATAVTAGIIGFAASPAQASGVWHPLGWYQYKSTCDTEGKKAVNQSSSDSYTKYMCERDSPGYQLYLYETWD